MGYGAWEDIPFDLRVPPKVIEQATVMQCEMTVGLPLTLRRRMARFLQAR